MKSSTSILLTVNTLLVFTCPSTAWKAFCPVRSPSNQLIYFTDTPSWSRISMLKTQCTMECSFCSVKKNCGDCRSFNYNSTSMNCSIFNFDPKKYAIDPLTSTVGYWDTDSKLSIRAIWSTVAAKMCAINAITNTKCSHVYHTDQYCGIDHYYCKLPNGTEAFCIPDNSTEETALPADCSFPFTYNRTLYNGCAPGIGCLTVNRTATKDCNTGTTNQVVNSTLNIGGQSVPVQSIFGWIVWMRRVGNTYNWSLPWNYYKNGFGSMGDDNYWLGLERVNQLTRSSKYRLRIEMKVNSTGEWYSVEYWSFAVGDESSTKYQLNVDGFSGDTRDGLQYVGCSSTDFANGMKFTTYDVDNDLTTSGNCAPTYGGGWWYTNCLSVCLTCSGTGFRWLDATSLCRSILKLGEARVMMKLQ